MLWANSRPDWTFKPWYVLYTPLVNINGYVPFLINRLDLFVRVGIFADKVVTTGSVYLLHVFRELCIF